MISKLWALCHILIGFFLVVVVGGKFLLQLLSIILGLILLFRGFVMLSRRQLASRFKSDFFHGYGHDRHDDNEDMGS